MRAKVAKRIKKVIYGDIATSASARQYTTDGKQIQAGDRRRAYKQAKRNYMNKA